MLTPPTSSLRVLCARCIATLVEDPTPACLAARAWSHICLTLHSRSGCASAKQQPLAALARHRHDSCRFTHCTTLSDQLAVPAASAAITVQDIKNVEQLAASPAVLDILARSLAPSIYGHNLIKKGLILLLLGGR